MAQAVLSSMGLPVARFAPKRGKHRCRLGASIKKQREGVNTGKIWNGGQVAGRRPRRQFGCGSQRARFQERTHEGGGVSKRNQRREGFRERSQPTRSTGSWGNMKVGQAWLSIPRAVTHLGNLPRKNRKKDESEGLKIKLSEDLSALHMHISRGQSWQKQ